MKAHIAPLSMEIQQLQYTHRNCIPARPRDPLTSHQFHNHHGLFQQQ